MAKDGGNSTVHFCYGSVNRSSLRGSVASSLPWNVLETRNGSDQTTWQYVWGTQYVDELVLADKNGDASGNDCDPDTDAQGETAGADHRWFYHQDRNWTVIALTDYVPSGGSGTNGAIVERYAYTPYGEFVVLKGAASGTELGNVLTVSSVGNPFAHQGLPLDQEKGSYQNRHREYVACLGRFAQRDPHNQRSGLSLYSYVHGRPLSALDPSGRTALGPPSARCQAVGPPRTDEQCCTAALSLFASGEYGMVVCCDGRKVACAKVPGTITDPMAYIIVYACILSHEATHFDDVTCGPNDGCPDPTAPPWDDPLSEFKEECTGYTAEYDCLMGLIELCDTTECRFEVLQQATVARLQKDFYCTINRVWSNEITAQM